ncbi:MAG: 50S ribosomal protein L15 [Thermodesulfobacteriota bacterium]
MLNTLSPSKGAKKNRKRVGRGPGCHGKTSGKGHKGQRARAGKTISRWFEGGQTPLKMRSPKRGFTNIFKKEVDIINIDDLKRFEGVSVITIDSLRNSGLSSGKNPIKLLGNGEISSKVTIQVNASSKSAIEKIEQAGGKVEIV